MKRTTLNLIIDTLMLIAMGIVSFSGFVLQYLTRRSYAEQYATLRDIVRNTVGLRRSGWHDAHLYTSFILLALLILHIMLHWPSIAAFFRRIAPNIVLRSIIYALLLLVAILSIVPWIATYLPIY